VCVCVCVCVCVLVEANMHHVKGLNGATVNFHFYAAYG